MSCSLFILQVVLKLFDYFWKPNGLFTSFVLYVCWCTSSYTVIIVLWKMLMEPVNAPARWWPCACLECVSGLRRLKKTLNFLRCLHVLTGCSNVVKTKMKETGYSFSLLFVLVGIVASVVGMSFFSCVSCFKLTFSPIALWRKRLQLDSKSDLTTNGFIL